MTKTRSRIARAPRDPSDRIQIYLTRSSANDKLVLDAWKIATEEDRPQDLFRRALVAGLHALAEKNELPEPLLKGIPALRRSAENLSKEARAAGHMVHSFAAGLTLQPGDAPAPAPRREQAPQPYFAQSEAIEISRRDPEPAQIVVSQPKAVAPKSAPAPIERSEPTPPPPAPTAANGTPTADDIMGLFSGN